MLRPVGLAQAQSTEETPSQRLDAQATELMRERDFRAACPLLAESARLETGTGVMMRLALCYELNGQLASAISAYREAARLARASGQDAISELALRRQQPLEARVPYLVFHAAEPSTERATLELDGALLESSAWHQARPIDPGPHHVEANAPGKRRFTLDFVVAPGAGNTLVAIALESSVPRAPRLAVRALPAVRPASTPYWTTRRTVAVAAGGLGVLSLAVGTAFSISTIHTFDEARAGCSQGNRGCTQRALDLQSAAERSATGADIALGSGVAFLGASAYLWLTANAKREPHPARASWTLAPTLTRGAGSLLLASAW